MARSNQTSEFLKECMADALIRLMHTKPLEKISVQEITDAAGVGRATWFRHFADKDEAIVFKLHRLRERWTQEHALPETDSRIRPVVSDFFHFFYQVRDFLQMLYAENHQSVLYTTVAQLVRSLSGADTDARYQVTFFSFGLLDEWVKSNFRETPEEMAALFFDVVHGAFISSPA